MRFAFYVYSRIMSSDPHYVNLPNYCRLVLLFMFIPTQRNVLVTHGGVEMGQGLRTNIAQIAASAFNIPFTSVFVSETSTDKVISDVLLKVLRLV